MKTALSTISATLFTALAIGAAVIKAGLAIVALFALIAFAYALDVARLTSTRAPPD